MAFQSFMEWAFLAIISAAVPAVLAILWKLNDNMSELNKKLAVILVEHATYKYHLLDHESRIRILERT